MKNENGVLNTLLYNLKTAAAFWLRLFLSRKTEYGRAVTNTVDRRWET